MSPRGYVYRNCTDGAAYWVAKYTGVDIRGWHSASNWDNAATGVGYAVKPNNSNNIEPGDLAQSEGPTQYGHVGFVATVNKDGSGNVISLGVAELNATIVNGTPQGDYKYKSYFPGEWDHYIDLNGTGKGLNNEAIDWTPTNANHWGVNSSGRVYQWNGSGWDLKPGTLAQVDVGDEGVVWGVNTIGNVFSWNGSSWVGVPGVLTGVSVGTN